MIEQTAIVISIDGQFALVEAQRESSCGQCNAKKGCGTGILENSVGRRAMQLNAINLCHAQPGDEVSLLYQWSGLEEENLNKILQPLVEAIG